MRVRCIRNSISELEGSDLKKWVKNYHSYDDDHQINFEKGKEYVVYGVHFWDSHPFYFLCDSEDNEYPVTQYAGFFEVVDDRIPANWKLSYKVDEDGKPFTSLLRKEWADDPMFYENLVEGDEKEEALFQKYKKEMDEEANS